MPDDEVSTPVCRKFLLATLPDGANGSAPFDVLNGLLAVTLVLLSQEGDGPASIFEDFKLCVRA